MNIEKTAISLTQDLVRIPSESSNHTESDPKHPENKVNEYLASFCITRAIDFELQEVTAGRNNFIAYFPKKNAPKLLITAHADTVSASGMTKAFSGDIADDKIWGRGACDDKGPLAAALSTLAGLQQQNRKLAYDVTFAATVDEECSMAGAAALATKLDPWDLCIGLEPTELTIINAHKGIHRCKISTRGVAAHSSTPDRGRNAIIEMHAIIADLQVLGLRIKRQHNSVLGEASLAITQIKGGSSVNIIPDYCQISVDTRLLPEQDPKQYTMQLEQLVGGRGEIKDIFYAGGIETDINHKPISRLQNAIAQCGYNPTPQAASYATDCSKLIKKGPCLVWGPGSISHAHQNDEHIEITQIKDACRILQMYLSAEH
nr:M20 family metallopeptidase [Desulfobulbaceae bacterium]